MRNRIELTIFIILVLALALACLVNKAHAQEPITDTLGCPQYCCQDPNVEAVWIGTGYWYDQTDNTAIVTGTATTVCWQGQGSHTVSEACVKAYFHYSWDYVRLGPGNGCWTSPPWQVSRVIVCTEEEATAARLTDFRVASNDWEGLAVKVLLSGAVGFTIGFILATILIVRALGNIALTIEERKR